jgi:hypothetical protein
LVRMAQGDVVRRANCLSGEAGWRDRFGN